MLSAEDKSLIKICQNLKYFLPRLIKELL